MTGNDDGDDLAPSDFVAAVRQFHAKAFAREHGRPPTDAEASSALDGPEPPPEPQEESRIALADLRAAVSRSGAHRRMVDVVFGRLLGPDGKKQMWPASASVTRWAERMFCPHVFCIAGKANAGKSVAAVLALVRRLQQLNRVIERQCIVSMVQLAEWSASGYEDRMDAVAALYHVPFLVIENWLAKQDLNHRHAFSVGSRLLDMLESRANNERPTLITTNESLDMLQQEWGGPLCSYVQKPRGYFQVIQDTETRRYPANDIRARAAKSWGRDIMPPPSSYGREKT